MQNKPKTDTSPSVVYISAEEAAKETKAESIREYVDPEPYSETVESLRELSTLAIQGNGVSRISIPREVKRQRVVTAFHDAFELIGGVPRLAHWADSHPTDFYKLYARILPGEVGQHVTHDGIVRIEHSVPKGPLDV